MGKGAFSTVYLATHRPSGKKFAVKVMDRDKMTREDAEGLVSEVSTQRLMRHPHIVRLVAFFDTDPARFHLVTELCTGGELFDRIVARDHFTERDAREVVLTLLDAVAYCHRHGIIHRDLKPENILLADTSEHAPIKIADFGFAIAHGGKQLSEQLGTPGYLAPEIIEARPYGPPVDMWAIGVIIYVILFGALPFDEKDRAAQFRRICRADYRFPADLADEVSAEAKDLIRKLLVVDQRRRLTAVEAMKHPWFTKTNLDDSPYLAQAVERLKTFHAKRRMTMLRSALRVSIMLAKRTGLLDRLAAEMEADEELREAAAGSGGGGRGAGRGR